MSNARHGDSARERRAMRRMPSDISVFLFHQGRPIGLGIATNVSRGGMLVTLSPRFELTLPAGHGLDLGFGVERDGITRRHTLAVRVRHCGNGALGVAFQGEGPAVDAALSAADR